jgi:CO/xanthine dehydrogenase FAD-binding subunit
VTTSFVTATSVDEAVAAMAGGARPVAGGTDLVVGARQGKAPLPDSIVAVHRIDELGGIENVDSVLRFGTLASHQEIADHPVVRERLTALADASAIVGSHATRAHGTLGGNVMNASPAMETGGPLLCFDATVTLHGPGGVRWVAVADLLTGPGTTSAHPDELLTAIDVSLPAERTGSCYLRLEYRRQMEIAVVGATAVVTLDESDGVADAKVAITALAPTIRRVPEAEAALVGTSGGDNAARAAADAAAAAAAPISDVRASDAYRRAMAAVITRRAVEAAVARARGDAIPIPASPALHGGLS